MISPFSVTYIFFWRSICTEGCCLLYFNDGRPRMKVPRQGVEEIEVSNGTLLDAEMTAHWLQGIRAWGLRVFWGLGLGI